MNRRVWFNEEKATIVLEMLRGDEPMAVICNRHGVSATQAYRWLDRFLEGGRKALADRRRGNGQSMGIKHMRTKGRRWNTKHVVLSGVSTEKPSEAIP